MTAPDVFVFVFLQGMGANERFTYAFSTVPQEIRTGEDVALRAGGAVDFAERKNGPEIATSQAHLRSWQPSAGYRNGVVRPFVSGLIRTCLPSLGTPSLSTTNSM
jgi:hypothetical protein